MSREHDSAVGAVLALEGVRAQIAWSRGVQASGLTDETHVLDYIESKVTEALAEARKRIAREAA
jgi:hypothetical protein